MLAAIVVRVDWFKSFDLKIVIIWFKSSNKNHDLNQTITIKNSCRFKSCVMSMTQVISILIGFIAYAVLVYKAKNSYEHDDTS